MDRDNSNCEDMEHKRKIVDERIKGLLNEVRKDEKLVGSDRMKEWFNSCEEQYFEFLGRELTKATDSVQIDTMEQQNSWVNNKCKFLKQKFLEKENQ